MVRVISQETFDDVVKENMEEFGMDKEEAIKEAIAQFESQGVSLSNIVTSGTAGDEGEHLVISALKGLSLAQPDDSKCLEFLTTIKAECDKGLPERVLATKEGAYDTLIEIALKNENLAVQKNVVAALGALLESNPDPFDARGFQVIVTSLTQQSDQDLIGETLELTLVICVCHEQNRQNLVKNGILNFLDQAYPQHDVRVARVWQALVQDDDIRVSFGKAHDHAREIVEEHHALEKLMDTIRANLKASKDVNLHLSCLSSLAVRNEYCSAVADNGGLATLLRVLMDPEQKTPTVKSTLMLLNALAGNDNVKKDIRSSQGVSIIVDAISRNVRDKATCWAGCSVIASICLRTSDNAQQVVDAGGARLIVDILSTHKSNAKVAAAATSAIRNIVSRSQHLVEPFVERDVEDLLNEVVKLHPDNSDKVKAALRDLGLKVHLKEEWSGAGTAQMAM